MAQDATAARRPKIAALANTYRVHLHAQHIFDRLLFGYGWNGVFHHPPLELVSLYVEQREEGDLSPLRAKQHPNMKVYNSVADALTLGTGKLAVDGVVYVGEHGNYPKNEKGQTLYPRYQFFKQVVDVFRSSGRSVPYFTDKHYSWNWEWAKDMFDSSRKMGFPMMAGSSAAIRWRIPSVEFPDGASVREAICVAFGGVDSYDFHGLEAIQSMVERRRGGETGVEWIQAYRGENFWKATEEGVWSPKLFKAAMCRSHNLMPGRPTFTGGYPTLAEMKALARNPVAYHYQHADGLRCTMMLLNGLVQDFNFAADIEGRAKPFSTQLYASREFTGATLENYFSPMAHYIEQMMLTGKEPYPAERNLMTTGLLCAAIDSLYQGEQRLKTPQLAIRYQPGKSTFVRA